MSLWNAGMDTLFRSIAAIIALQVLTRINGAKQISQLSFYDYITGITIGSLTAVMAIDDKIPFYLPLLSITLFICASYLEGQWTMHSLKARKWIDGMPIILMLNGQILAKNLKKAHLTVNELLSEARVAGYFQLRQISIAIMESSGKLSFLPFAQQQPLRPIDVGIKKADHGVYIALIIDGEVLKEELAFLQKDETWLLHQLTVQGIRSVEDVFLALANRQGDVCIYPKENTEVHKGHFL